MVVRFRAPLDGAPRHAPPSAPFPIVPPGVHAHLGTRVLDPASAVRPAETRIDPTVYFSRRLLVRGVPGGSADAASQVAVRSPVGDWEVLKRASELEMDQKFLVSTCPAAPGGVES